MQHGRAHLSYKTQARTMTSQHPAGCSSVESAWHIQDMALDGDDEEDELDEDADSSEGDDSNGEGDEDDENGTFDDEDADDSGDDEYIKRLARERARMRVRFCSGSLCFC